jgi:hypothetical protein
MPVLAIVASSNAAHHPTTLSKLKPETARHLGPLILTFSPTKRGGEGTKRQFGIEKRQFDPENFLNGVAHHPRPPLARELGLFLEFFL